MSPGIVTITRPSGLKIELTSLEYYSRARERMRDIMKTIFCIFLVLFTGYSSILAAATDKSEWESTELLNPSPDSSDGKLSAINETKIQNTGNKGPLERYFPKVGHIGPAFGSMEYKEPGLMKHDGLLYGVKGGATVTGPADSSYYFFFNGELLIGRNTYNGAYWDGRPLKDDITVTAGSGRIGMGQALITTNSFLLALTGGMGIRNYTTDGNAERGFYYRSTNYLFLPLGTEIQWAINNKHRLYLKGEYDLFLSGRNETRLSDVNSNYKDQVHTQKKGKGYRISTGYGFQLSEKFDGFAELFYQSWNVDNSESVYLGNHPELGGNVTTLEPKNTTAFVGFGAGMSF